MDKKKYVVAHITNLKPNFPNIENLTKDYNPTSQYEDDILIQDRDMVIYPNINDIKFIMKDEYKNYVLDVLIKDYENISDNFEGRRKKKNKEDLVHNNIIRILQGINNEFLKEGRIGKNNKAYTIEELQVFVKKIGLSGAGKRKGELIDIILDLKREYNIV